MITLYVGERAQAIDAIRLAIQAHQKKYPNARAVRFEENEATFAVVEEAMGSGSLFGAPTIVFCEGVFAGTERETFLRALEIFARSPNTILFFEEKALKPLRTAFEATGARIEEFTKKETKEVERGPRVFALADAFIARDKRSAWTLLTQVLREGAEAEEVHGTLVWALKMAILSRKLPKAEAVKAGVKPFVYGKYGKGSLKWEEGEQERALRELKDMYHDAHRGAFALADALERYILGSK